MGKAREFMIGWTSPEKSSFSAEDFSSQSMGSKLDEIMELSPESKIAKEVGRKSGSLWAVPLLSELDVLAAKYAALSVDHEALKKSHATLKEELDNLYATSVAPKTSPFDRLPSVLTTLEKSSRTSMTKKAMAYMAEAFAAVPGLAASQLSYLQCLLVKVFLEQVGLGDAITNKAVLATVPSRGATNDIVMVTDTYNRHEICERLQQTSSGGVHMATDAGNKGGKHFLVTLLAYGRLADNRITEQLQSNLDAGGDGANVAMMLLDQLEAAGANQLISVCTDRAGDMLVTLAARGVWARLASCSTTTDHRRTISR